MKVAVFSFERVKEAVRIVYNGTCQYCGRKDAKHVEHIRPRAQGGTDDIKNLTLACTPCNLRKQAILLDPMHYAIATARAAAKEAAVLEALTRHDRPRQRKSRTPAPPSADDSAGFFYAGFAAGLFPHKRRDGDASWRARSGHATLVAEPGRDPAGNLIGLPYGARARMILLHLQTQAIRNGSPHIELGRSLREWLGKMGLSWGGETGRALREQVQRIAACSIRVEWDDDKEPTWHTGGHIHPISRSHTARQDGQQPSLWEDRVVLDEVFFAALRQHPVPLREAALRELADRSLSLDIYIWLAYRLHALDRRTPVRWAALSDQFGGSYSRHRDFVREFAKALAPAVVAYPEAKVEVDDEGLILHPSRPPVAPRLVAVS